MKIDVLVIGELSENCYILTKNDKSIIIDPGDEAKRIIDFCSNKNVVGILVTHHHFDHIGALKEIESYYNIKESQKVEGFSFEVLKTPGHTDDSVCYYFKEEKVLFSGDFLFYNSIGRTDLPTGSDKNMQQSLKFISEYPDDITIYPGHGRITTLGEEKELFKYYY